MTEAHGSGGSGANTGAKSGSGPDLSADLSPPAVEPMGDGASSAGVDEESTATTEAEGKGFDSRVEVGTNQGTTIGVQYQQFYESFEARYVSGEGWKPPRKLSEADFDTIPHEELILAGREIVVSSKDLESLEVASARQRLVLIEGRSRMGKGYLARSLASRLCDQPRGPQHLKLPKLRLRNVQLTFDLFAEKEFHRSVVLLKDLFQGRAPDSRSLGKSLDLLRISNLEGKLEENETTVILTLDPEEAQELHPDLAARVVPVQGPGNEQLASYLRQRAERLIDAGRVERTSEIQARLESLSERAAELVRQLPTVPDLEELICSASFERFLKGEVTLDEAWKQVQQLDRRWFEEAKEKPESLALLLALALCRADPEGLPIRWYAFDHVRHRIESFLRRELDWEDEHRSAAGVLDQEALLRRFGARVVRTAEGLAEIHFEDEARADRLWAGLLGPGRPLAGLLVDPLLDWAGSRRFYLHKPACWGLGRIAALDPHAIFGQHLTRWIGKKRYSRQVGYCYQSALASGSEPLRLLVWEQVRRLTSSGDPERLQVGIQLLGVIGETELRSALELLADLARSRLLRRLDRFDVESQVFAELERHLQETDGFALRQFLSSLREASVAKMLRSGLSEVFGRDLDVLQANQYALVGLFFHHGTHPVLVALKSWMPTGQTKMARLLALMLLRPWGVFGILESYPVQESDSAKPQSRFLSGASFEDGGPAVLAEFLLDLHVALWDLPGCLSRPLEARWYALLEHWIDQAAEQPRQLAPPVHALWEQLLQTYYPEIREKLRDLLDRLQAEHGMPEARKLAKEIRARSEPKLIGA